MAAMMIIMRRMMKRIMRGRCQQQQEEEEQECGLLIQALSQTPLPGCGPPRQAKAKIRVPLWRISPPLPEEEAVAVAAVTVVVGVEVARTFLRGPSRTWPTAAAKATTETTKAVTTAMGLSSSSSSVADNTE
jgi:hypothetical protein